MKSARQSLLILMFAALCGLTKGSAQCPTSIADTITADQSVSKIFQLQADNPGGHGIRFGLLTLFWPQQGTVEMLNDSTGEVRYTPDFGYCGSDQVEFDVRSITDPTCNSSRQYVRINIACNQCPQAIDTSVSVRRGVSTQIQLRATDPENNEIFFRDYFPFPSHGTVDVDSNGMATYTPDPGYCGPDLFWFRVRDGFNTDVACLVNSGSAARVMIDVRCNECPTATDVHVSVVRGSSVTFQLDGSDLDGDPLTYTYTPPGVNCGSITSFLPGGEVTYSTAGCGNASTQFTYRVSDGTCLSDEATVYITISDPVPVDVKPGSCPNPLVVSDQGQTPVAILGTSSFDVTEVNPATVRLAGVAPVHWVVDDVAAPYTPFIGKSDCRDCSRSKKDKRRDLALKFNSQELVAALGTLTDGECRVLRLTALLTSGQSIVGEDVVRIIGSSSQVAGGEAAALPRIPEELPEAYALDQNFPNPFNPETRITYALPEPAHARLIVYDVLGSKVKILVDEMQPAGVYEMMWDGKDGNGQSVTSGVYFLRFTAGSFTGIRKMILTR